MRLKRYDPNMGDWQITIYKNEITCGDEFEVKNGEGYLVYMKVDKRSSFQGSIINPYITLEKGFDMVSFSFMPPGYTSYDLLLDLGSSDQIDCIQRFNRETGIFEATVYLYGCPSGIEFQIGNGEAYVVYIKIGRDLTGL